MTTPKRFSTTELVDDDALRGAIIEVFRQHGPRPRKELGYEIRQQLPAQYRQLGNTNAMFSAIRRIVARLERAGVLELDVTGTHYQLSPLEPQSKQPRRKSRDRHVGRQNLISASTH